MAIAALILIAQACLPLASAKATTVDDQELCEHKSDCSGAPFDLCKGGVCTHKQLFPMLTSEVIGIITLPLLLGLANMGGIGGGGLVIPLAIGCWGFSTN